MSENKNTDIDFKDCVDEDGVAITEKVYEKFTDGMLKVLNDGGCDIKIEEPHNTKEAKDKVFEYINENFGKDKE